MTKARKPHKKPSGASSLKASNRVGLLVSMTREQRQAIRVAAANSGKSMAAWVLEVALRQIISPR